MTYSASSRQSISRRALLGGASAAGLIGLASCSQNPRPSQPSSASTGTHSTSDGSPSESPSPSTEPTAEESAAPEPASYEEIAEQLQGTTPQEWGLEVTGVVTSFSAAGTQAVLTFDACGGPDGDGYDQELIDTLRSTDTPATLFINQRWAEANPNTTQELVDDPLFEIANHGTRHLPVSVNGREAYGIPGTASLQEAYAEIVESRDFFYDTYGVDTTYFRSGTAHVDEVVTEMAEMLGIQVVNFSVNADGGATLTPQQVQQELARVGGGDICIGHFNRPGSGTGPGVAAALDPAAERGVEWITLKEALNGGD